MGYTIKDLQINPGILSVLLKKANIQVRGNVRDKSNLLLSEREYCSERGYHRVESEPRSEKSLMICYDCDLWFDKRFAKSSGLKYRVEPD